MWNAYSVGESKFFYRQHVTVESDNNNALKIANKNTVMNR